jgi:hypothetical protein
MGWLFFTFCILIHLFDRSSKRIFQNLQFFFVRFRSPYLEVPFCFISVSIISHDPNIGRVALLLPIFFLQTYKQNQSMSIPINGVFFASLKMGYCIPENSEMGIIIFFKKSMYPNVYKGLLRL